MQCPRPLTLLALTIALACGGQPPQEGMRIQGLARPEAVVSAGARAQTRAAQTLDRKASGINASAAEAPKQILFGDLHVHSTFSQDAYLFSLPIMGGEGARPPADACDFARYCSNLDFYSVTDHAESLRPDHWEISKQSVRECNALAGDARNPDVVAFAGFEWTQAGLTPEEHFGHRCVIFEGQADDDLPARPIASGDKRAQYLRTAERVGAARFLDWRHWARYTDYIEYAEANLGRPVCDENLSTLELPGECLEVAETPRELHRKLDEWSHGAQGRESLDIPHGTTWGVYTPATTTIAKHLEPEYYDAEKMKLIEIMSGHGNSEEYRPWREWRVDDAGNRVCEPPSEGYLPCCWQAGEIMRSRCGDLPEAECQRRVELARDYATEAWTRPHQIFPDAASEEWLDCGQCRDCFKPSFGYRPRESVQYAMALSHPEATTADGAPLRFRYGFIGSSDEHSSRPGVGYKGVDRGLMTDVNQVSESGLASMVGGARMDDPRMPVRPGAREIGLSGNDGRVGNFLFPGGLAAVHADSRSREDIWDALQRKEVYGTSGPRILLWFDHLEGALRTPMGGEVRTREAPEFEVRAVGSFEPKPGCPDWAVQRLGAERIRNLCHDECYHPSDVRRPIVAIDVIRILPQQHAGEPIDPLIQDPWRRFACDPSPEGCVVRFRDDEYPDLARDALYYARAVEAARPGILGAGLSTQFDADGNATSIELCGTFDDCTGPVEERAWSSPIFVDFEDA